MQPLSSNKVSQFNSDSQSVGEGLALGGTMSNSTGVSEHYCANRSDRCWWSFKRSDRTVTTRKPRYQSSSSSSLSKVDFRSHQLDYKFVARNQTESNTLKASSQHSREQCSRVKRNAES